MPDLPGLVVATNDFRPMVGGVADYLHRLAQAMAGTRPVTVMTPVAQNAAVWDRAYRLEPLPPLPDRQLGRRFGDGVPIVRKLRTGVHFMALRRHADRAVAALDADSEILIGLWDTASHFWCEACRRRGLRYSLVAYGLELTHPFYGRLPEWRRRDFEGAHRIVAISRATADLVTRRFTVTAPPVVLNPSAGPRPPAEAVAARAATLQRSLDANGASGPVLLSVGRLVARKGFDLVMHTVAWLRRGHPDVRYLVIGTGPERMPLEKLAGELGVASNVRFLGQADDLTKWAAFDLCDLFVMPNRSLDGADWEGFGIVFVEAALAGRASVAGRSGGTADAVVDRETGLLVDPERPGELTDAVRRLLDDETLRRRMGEAGRRRAAALFSEAAFAGRLRAVLEGGSAP